METPAMPVQNDRSSRRSVNLLIVVILVAVGLMWRGCWFGTRLSDAKLETYLSGSEGEQKIQHALVQLDERIIEKKLEYEQFIPTALKLATHPLAEIRKTLAWVLSDYRGAVDVFPTLHTLLSDTDLAVRGQAALALANHGDVSGREVILSLLLDLELTAPHDGVVRQALKVGEPVVEGMRVLRLERSGHTPTDVTAPIPGKVILAEVKSDDFVQNGQVLMKIRPADKQVAAALAGLVLVGRSEDVEAVEALRSFADLSARTVEMQKKVVESLRRPR